MKTRIGFVSNSSSSSFLVIKSDIFVIPHMPKQYKDKTTLLVPHTFGGETEFGRQRQNYGDFGSRLNFAYLIALQLEKCRETDASKFHEDFLKDKRRMKIFKRKGEVKLLEKVLIDNIPGLKTIKWHLVENEYGLNDDREHNTVDGYIDHGSTWSENFDNYYDIFENEDSVFQWLFGAENYIANRSDEYGDASELEVDHRQDYSWDYVNEQGQMVDLYFNEYNDPDRFDKKGNFIEPDDREVQS